MKPGPKELQRQALRARNLVGDQIKPVAAAKSAKRDAPAGPQKPSPGEQVAAPCSVCAADPILVAKAVPFYLKHLERSKVGMVAYRKRQKKKKTKADKKA